jgi:hypothetical protein
MKNTVKVFAVVSLGLVSLTSCDPRMDLVEKKIEEQKAERKKSGEIQFDLDRSYELSEETIDITAKDSLNYFTSEEYFRKKLIYVVFEDKKLWESINKLSDYESSLKKSLESQKQSLAKISNGDYSYSLKFDYERLISKTESDIEGLVEIQNNIQKYSQIDPNKVLAKKFEVATITDLGTGKINLTQTFITNSELTEVIKIESGGLNVEEVK